MFLDSFWEKLKKILLPFLLWVGFGAVAELLSVLVLGITLGKEAGNGISVLRMVDFQTLLEAAHDLWEPQMLLFRDLASLPFFIIFFRKDNVRIRYSLEEYLPILQRPVFFTKASADLKRKAAIKIILGIFLGIFFAISGNGLLNLLKLQGGAGTLALAGREGFSFSLLLFNLLLAPVMEEFLARGLIYRRFRTYLGILPAVLLSSALFALFHMDPVQSIYALLFGLLLADLYEMTSDLSVCILAHMAANATSILFMTVKGLQAFSNNHPVPLFVISTLLLFGMLFLTARSEAD